MKNKNYALRAQSHQNPANHFIFELFDSEEAMKKGYEFLKCHQLLTFEYEDEHFSLHMATIYEECPKPKNLNGNSRNPIF